MNTQPQTGYSSGRRILVVDDHPGTAKTLAVALSRLGNDIKAVSATSGLQALECAQEEDIDILITDMQMPGMTGLELIEQLQQRLVGGPAFSFLISAGHMSGMNVVARRLHVREVLYKPIHPQKICKLVHQALQEMDQREPGLNLSGDAHVTKLYTALLEGVTDAILIFDAGGRLLLINPPGRGLFTDYEMKLGQGLPPAAGYDSLIKHLDDAQLTGVSFSGEICWPDNRVFSTTLTPVKDVGCVVALHDVTRFKRLERIKDEFIASASHDLRNMITAINGFSQLIRRTGPINETQNDFIQHIQHATNNMQETVEIMMDHAKFGLVTQMGFEELDIGQLVWQLVDEFQLRAEAKQLLLVVEKTEPDLKVHGDPLHLRQALRNLIGNAIKSTSDGGTIKLSIYNESNLVCIAIRDASYGVSAADLPSVFDQFYRARYYGRDGLESNNPSLAIVKAIAEEHRGIVTIESETGKGPCLTLKLPLAQVEVVER